MPNSPRIINAYDMDRGFSVNLREGHDVALVEKDHHFGRSLVRRAGRIYSVPNKELDLLVVA